MKPLDVNAQNLHPYLIGLVQKFQRDTGIDTRFVCDPTVVNIRRRACEAVARIVQEALVNVRKHSDDASHVLVQLDRRDGHWRLTIEDDGPGFPFSGRFSQAELEADGKGPLVIIEYVRLIGGELTLESTPGRGSQLEIAIPQKRSGLWILNDLIQSELS